MARGTNRSGASNSLRAIPWCVLRNPGNRGKGYSVRRHARGQGDRAVQRRRSRPPSKRWADRSRRHPSARLPSDPARSTARWWASISRPSANT
jgi:hypothetical protein